MIHDPVAGKTPRAREVVGNISRKYGALRAWHNTREINAAAESSVEWARATVLEASVTMHDALKANDCLVGPNEQVSGGLLHLAAYI
jgi:hypothetical protein